MQTIHAFCEKLLRRFPLEAGVSPGFRVLEDVGAAQVSARARDGVAGAALEAPDGPIATAYSHFSVQLDWASFNAMFAAFEWNRTAIGAYVAACEFRAVAVSMSGGVAAFSNRPPAQRLKARRSHGSVGSPGNAPRKRSHEAARPPTRRWAPRCSRSARNCPSQISAACSLPRGGAA